MSCEERKKNGELSRFSVSQAAFVVGSSVRLLGAIMTCRGWWKCHQCLHTLFTNWHRTTVIYLSLLLWIPSSATGGVWELSGRYFPHSVAEPNKCEYFVSVSHLKMKTVDIEWAETQALQQANVLFLGPRQSVAHPGQFNKWIKVTFTPEWSLFLLLPGP